MDNDTSYLIKVRQMIKIRNRYNQAPHLTQDTNGKVTATQLDFTYESHGVSPYPVGDHKASKPTRVHKSGRSNCAAYALYTTAFGLSEPLT